jgi:hypothetical protein
MRVTDDRETERVHTAFSGLSAYDIDDAEVYANGLCDHRGQAGLAGEFEEVSTASVL